MKKLALFALLVTGVSGVAVAKPKPTDDKKPPAPAPKMGGASTAVTSDILDAVASEMNRAMASLQLGSNQKPYYISYKLTEVDVKGHASNAIRIELDGGNAAVEGRPIVLKAGRNRDRLRLDVHRNLQQRLWFVVRPFPFGQRCADSDVQGRGAGDSSSGRRL